MPCLFNGTKFSIIKKYGFHHDHPRTEDMNRDGKSETEKPSEVCHRLGTFRGFT